jgi:hypothetical protein
MKRSLAGLGGFKRNAEPTPPNPDDPLWWLHGGQPGDPMPPQPVGPGTPNSDPNQAVMTSPNYDADSEGYHPPPGAYYHNGAWFDNNDRLIGYAPTEDAPLDPPRVPGPPQTGVNPSDTVPVHAPDSFGKTMSENWMDRMGWDIPATASPAWQEILQQSMNQDGFPPGTTVGGVPIDAPPLQMGSGLPPQPTANMNLPFQKKEPIPFGKAAAQAASVQQNPDALATAIATAAQHVQAPPPAPTTMDDIMRTYAEVAADEDQPQDINPGTLYNWNESTVIGDDGTLRQDALDAYRNYSEYQYNTARNASPNPDLFRADKGQYYQESDLTEEDIADYQYIVENADMIRDAINNANYNVVLAPYRDTLISKGSETTRVSSDDKTRDPDFALATTGLPDIGSIPADEYGLDPIVDVDGFGGPGRSRDLNLDAFVPLSQRKSAGGLRKIGAPRQPSEIKKTANSYISSKRKSVPVMVKTKAPAPTKYQKKYGTKTKRKF